MVGTREDVGEPYRFYIALELFPHQPRTVVRQKARFPYRRYLLEARSGQRILHDLTECSTVHLRLQTPRENTPTHVIQHAYQEVPSPQPTTFT